MKQLAAQSAQCHIGNAARSMSSPHTSINVTPITIRHFGGITRTISRYRNRLKEHMRYQNSPGGLECFIVLRQG